MLLSGRERIWAARRYSSPWVGGRAAPGTSGCCLCSRGRPTRRTSPPTWSGRRRTSPPTCLLLGACLRQQTAIRRDNWAWARGRTKICQTQWKNFFWHTSNQVSRNIEILCCGPGVTHYLSGNCILWTERTATFLKVQTSGSKGSTGSLEGRRSRGAEIRNSDSTPTHSSMCGRRQNGRDLWGKGRFDSKAGQ